MGLIEDVRADGLGGLSHNVITGRLEDPADCGPGACSSWPASFGLACCAIEMMATGGAHYDIAAVRHGGVPPARRARPTS